MVQKLERAAVYPNDGTPDCSLRSLSICKCVVDLDLQRSMYDVTPWVCVHDDGAAVFLASSTADRPMSSLSELILYLLLAQPPWMVAVRQKASFICARMGSTKVGGSYVGFSILTFVFLMCRTWWMLLLSGVSEMFAFTTWLMDKIGSSSSSGLSCFPFVESRDSVSAAQCFIPAPWVTLKSIFDKRRCQRASCPVEVKRLRINVSALWSVWTVKRWPSRYVHRSSNDQTVVRHSRFMVPNCWYVRWASMTRIQRGL